ncbi:MAG: carbohydrate ABC transporter permease [Pseudomonadota bacterium]
MQSAGAIDNPSPWYKVGLSGAALVAVLYSFFPIYWMIVSSTRDNDVLYETASLIPGPFTLGHYETLLAHTDYPTQFLNSILVASGTVVITLICAVMIAYAVTRLQFPGKMAVVATMLYAYMFPPLLLAIPLFSIFIQLGIDDSLFALIISHCTLTLPLGVWLLWGFFKQMPFQLEEAAMVDGCTRIGAFFRVVLPLSRPGLLTVTIFSFLLSWTDYTYALVMVASDAQKTLPVGLASMLGTYELRWGELMAGSTLIALPLLILFCFMSSYFIRGLAAGAVKG